MPSLPTFRPAAPAAAAAAAATVTAHDGEIDRSAFNAAFYELGLRWHWDSETYASLAVLPCEREQVSTYLEREQRHLLRAYDAEFLTDAILDAKRRRRVALARCAPSAAPRFKGADVRWVEAGV